MSATTTLRFPDDNPGWTYYVEGDGEETTMPAQGPVQLPADARIHLQTRGGLDALRAVPRKALSGLTAMDVREGDLAVLAGYDGLTSLFAQGHVTDADMEAIAPALVGVEFLVLGSDSLSGTCFSSLTLHPRAALSVWANGLTDEGLAALLELPVRSLRTRAPELSSELLRSVQEIAAQDVMVGLTAVAADDLVALAARSPQLTALNLISEAEQGGDLLEPDAILALRRRRPDLTINGSWFDAETVDRVASGHPSSLVVDATAAAAEPVQLTAENFDELTAGATPVLVDFMAEWCGPCKKLAPTLHEITAELAGRLVVGSLDIQQEMAIADRYEISAIPALLLFRDGRPVARIGAREKNSIYAELDAVL
jgi:thioredoxin 1